MADSAWQDSLDAACDGIRQLAGSAAGQLLRVCVKSGDLEIELEWPPAAAGEPAAGPPGAAGEAASEWPGAAGESPAAPAGHLIRAPMSGTFYHSPEPGALPFVSPGDVLAKGEPVGIIEAMKLMNLIDADQGGRVAEILAADAAPVDSGEPLIALAADSGSAPLPPAG